MPVGVVQDFNSWSCPSSWGVMCLLGMGKHIGGEAKKMAVKVLAFPGGGKGVPVPSSSAADPHHEDEVRNVGLLGVRSSWRWR